MITFNKAHIATIADLDKIAKKHNYRFTIYIDTNYSHPDDFYISEELADNDEDLEFINDNDLFLDGYGVEKKVEFCIVNNETGKVHSLISSNYEGFIEYDLYAYEQLGSDYYLPNESGNGNVNYEIKVDRTIGFDNVKYKHNIYRPGIMLREFYVMVCELLNEKQVVRNY